ncbi:circadian locomoter output cycles protein kaput [Penaeus vannamei]|uniref:circadian locomoter output cycles protein kaput n=1 Tax=Penaeus vannamei TaxID=6689 RepID=UPI00387F783E
MSGRSRGSIASDKPDISARHTSTTANNPPKTSSTSATASSSKVAANAEQHASMGAEQKFSSSSREMRNLAEKMRRDKLNNYVTELAGIVPLGSGANKRVDKTSVLRLAANYIRMHKLLKDEEGEGDRLSSLMRGDISNTLAEAVGGFLLVVTSSGKVVYITEAVEQFFGHSQVDLLGHSIYNVIHPDDHDIFQHQLQAKEHMRRSFFCRMMEKALSRNDPGRYEIIHIVGQMKPIPQAEVPVPSPSMSASSPETASTSSKHGDEDDNDESDGDVQSLKVANRTGTHMLVSFVRVVKDRPITELSLVDSTQEEYITRHGTDGKILYTDHRISFVTGLMPSEVLGTSAFNYMHQDDMLWSVVAQKLMLTSSQGQGVVSYRLRCKDGKYVTLRTRGFLEFNKQKGQVDSFVCINTVLSVKDAASEIKNQRRKLLPMITCQESDEHLNSISSSFPPEMVMMLKQLINPDIIQKMINSVEQPEFGSEGPGKNILDEVSICSSSVNSRNLQSEDESEFNWQNPRNKRAKLEPHSDSSTRCYSENIQNVQIDKDGFGFEEVKICSFTKKQRLNEPFTKVSTQKFSFQREFTDSNPTQTDYSPRSVHETIQSKMSKQVVTTFASGTGMNRVLSVDSSQQQDTASLPYPLSPQDKEFAGMASAGKFIDSRVGNHLSSWMQQSSRSPNLLSPECFPQIDAINQAAGSSNSGSDISSPRNVDQKIIPSPRQFDQNRSGSIPSPGSCDMSIPFQSAGMSQSPNPCDQRSQTLSTGSYDERCTSLQSPNPCVGSLASLSQYDQRGGSLSSSGHYDERAGHTTSQGVYDQSGQSMPVTSQGDQRRRNMPSDQYDQRDVSLSPSHYIKPLSMYHPKSSSMLSSGTQSMTVLHHRNHQLKSEANVTSGEQLFESQIQICPQYIQTPTTSSIPLQQQPQQYGQKQFSKPIQGMSSSDMGHSSYLSTMPECNIQTGILQQHQSRSDQQTASMNISHVQSFSFVGEGNNGSYKTSQTAGQGNDMARQYSPKFKPNTTPTFDPAVSLLGSDIFVPVTLSMRNQSERQHKHSTTH